MPLNCKPYTERTLLGSTINLAHSNVDLSVSRGLLGRVRCVLYDMPSAGTSHYTRRRPLSVTAQRSPHPRLDP